MPTVPTHTVKYTLKESMKSNSIFLVGWIKTPAAIPEDSSNLNQEPGLIFTNGTWDESP